MAYMGEPAKAVKQYVGAEYIQHNPKSIYLVCSIGLLSSIYIL